MKKYLNILITFIIFLFVGALNVKAASIDSVSGDNTNGKSFKVKISNANGWIFNYKSVLSCSGSNTSANTNPYGRKINADSVELTCIINTSEYEDLTLSLVDPGQNHDTVTKKYELNPSKKTTTTTTAPATTTVQASKSNNANLKSLIVKTADDKLVTLTPEFTSSVYEYQAEVDSSVKTVTINTSMEDNKATLIISNNAQQELKAGENNKITVTVTAEDGTKRVYTLNIKRGALTSDATLKKLTIKEDKSFKLKENKYSYVVNIKESVKKLTLDYELNDENSTVKVSGNKKLKDGSKVKILVTAQDGTKKEYTLLIKKQATTTKVNVSNIKEEKNSLIIMGLSIIAFSLIGAIIYVVKK